MAKPIPQEIKDAFAEFAAERFADEDACGEFSLEELDEIIDDMDEWEFHASNHDPDDTHCFYELFDSAKDFQVEEHGYDSFFVVEREE